MVGSFVPLGGREVVPGKLSVTLADCALGARTGERAWVYTTRGLEAVGQREMVLALACDRQRETEDCPRFPMRLFAQIHTLAQRGMTVDAGSRTGLADPGVCIGLGADGPVGGVLYVTAPVPGWPIPGLELSGFRRRPLLALPVTPGELALADRFGHARLLALLGAGMRVHPHPWWFDGRRAAPPGSDLDPSGHDGRSLLANITRWHLPCAQVVRTGERLTLELAHDDAPRLLTLLQQAPDVCALLTGTPERTAVNLAWGPASGRVGTHAAGPDPDPDPRHAPLGGNFLVLAHGDVPPSAAEVEDGFALTVPDRTHQRLVAAVRERVPFRCDLDGPHAIRAFDVTWVSRTHTTVDGDRVYAEGGFHRYAPPARSAERSTPGAVAPQEVVLLAGQQELELTVGVEALSDYVRAVAAALGAAGEGRAGGLPRTVVEFRLTPGRSPHVLVDAGGGDDRGLAARLERVPAPRVRHMPVHFQVVFAAAG